MTSVVTTKGACITLDENLLNELKANVRGKVIVNTDQDYDSVREIWNAMIDRRPGLIVRCSGTADVVACVKFAREHDLKVTVRGAGHNIAGKSLMDDAMLINLSLMRSVRVDPKQKVANVAPGATLGDVDHETKGFGLVVPVGINSTTGISGFTLGGGIGWLSRKFGITCDNVLSAEVVKADGSVVRCDKDNEPDMFWAIRGGGGNFGIVTDFEFQLHECGPEVMSGPIIFPFEQGEEVLKGYNELAMAASDDMTPWLILRKCPPFPFVAEEHHFKPVIVLAACFAGPNEKAIEAIAPYRALGNPIGDAFGPHPMAGWNQAFDPMLTPGSRNYWKTHNFTDPMSDGLQKVVLDAMKTIPNMGTEIFFLRLGGAVNRVPSDFNAYAHRNVDYGMNIHTRWDKEEDDDLNLKWARTLYGEIAPFASGTMYSNFVSDGDENNQGTYAGNLDRLVKAKARYDPDNFFSVNYNVRPTPNPNTP